MSGAASERTVLGKTAAVLAAFTSEDTGLPLAELGRRTGLAKTTLHRLCGHLVETGFLERTGVEYRLGRQLFELGMRATVERTLLEAATPYLEELRAAVHETVHLGVRAGTEVVYVAKLAGHGQAPSPSRPGGRLGLHHTAIGKVLLAHAPSAVVVDVVAAGLVRRTPRTVTAPGVLVRQLAQVRAAGVAFEYEESRVGLVCVGAPVLDHGGQVVAAVSVAGPVSRFHPRSQVDRVRAAADGISRALAVPVSGTRPVTRAAGAPHR